MPRRVGCYCSAYFLCPVCFAASIKRVLIMLFCTQLFTSVNAFAQHIDLGFDAGKAYSIVDGAFVPSTVPSVTLLFGPVELSTSSYFYGRRFFEQDTKLTWYQRADAARRWSLFGTLAHYQWPNGRDINGQAGLRWRLK